MIMLVTSSSLAPNLKSLSTRFLLLNDICKMVDILLKKKKEKKGGNGVMASLAIINEERKYTTARK